MTRSVPPPVGAALLAGVVTILAVVVGWPLVALVGAAARAGWPVASAVVVSLAFSMLVAAAVAGVTVALAGCVAFAVTRERIVARRVVVVALLLPLVTPPAIVALAIRFVLELAGAVPLTATAGALAVAAAQVVALLPHAFVVLANALAGIDGSVEDAAVSLGATRGAAFRRTTLALVPGSLGCAALVVWTLALSDLASPLLLGGSAPLLAGYAFAAVRDGRMDVAAAAAAALTAPALAAWLVALRLGWSRLAPAPAERLIARSPSAAPGGACAVVAVVVAAITAACVLVMPLVWLRRTPAFAFGDVAAIVVVSVAVAIVAAGAGTVMAFAIAVLTARSRRRMRGAAWLGVSTAGVPGVALALGAVVAFDPPPGAATLWLLAALVAAWKLPTAVVLATRRFEALDPALEEAAVSLGAGERTIAWRIVIPRLAPAAGAAFLDLAVQALTSSGLLLVFAAGAGAVVWHSLNGDIGGAAAVGMALGAVATVIVLLRLWLAPREPVTLLPA